MANIQNELKIDIIKHRQGENEARINFIQLDIESSSNQELIEQYQNNINDLLAKNLALELLKETLI
jgi:hypothetical protein